MLAPDGRAKLGFRKDPPRLGGQAGQQRPLPRAQARRWLGAAQQRPRACDELGLRARTHDRRRAVIKRADDVIARTEDREHKPVASCQPGDPLGPRADDQRGRAS